MGRKIRTAIIAPLILSFLANTCVVLAPLPLYAEQPLTPIETLAPEEISIPPDLGLVQEIHRAPNNGSRGLIIYLQDAHCVYDAQTNIRLIIDHLQKKAGLSLVALEGGEGELDSLVLRAFPEKSVQRDVIDRYVSRGDLSGAEAAAVLNEKEGTFVGIEDFSLYVENRNAFLETQDALAAFRKIHSEIEGDLLRAAEQLYSPALLEVTRRIRNFRAHQTDVLPFLESMTNTYRAIGGKKSLFSRKYPSLSQLLREASREKHFDPHEIETLTNALQLAVERHLHRLGRNQLLKFKDTILKMKEQREIYSFILREARRRGILAKKRGKFGKLLLYREHLDQLEEIKGDEFFRQLENFVQEVKDRFISDDRSRHLDRLFSNLDLLQKLAHLELRREEWTFIVQNQPELKEHSFLVFLSNLGLALDRPAGKLDAVLKPMIRFYDLAFKREDILYRHLQSRMASDKRKLALLITGGFHTYGLKEKLEEGDYSYVVVTPKIESLKGSENYARIMGESSGLQGPVREKSALATTLNLMKAVRAAELNQRRATMTGSVTSDYMEELLDRRIEFHLIRRTLKNYRDALIGALGKEGRLGRAEEYTRYVDALFKSLEAAATERRVTPEMLAEIESGLNAFLRQSFNQERDFIRAAFRRFRQSLQGKDVHSLAPEDVLNLLIEILEGIPAVKRAADERAPLDLEAVPSVLRERYTPAELEAYFDFVDIQSRIERAAARDGQAGITDLDGLVADIDRFLKGRPEPIGLGASLGSSKPLGETIGKQSLLAPAQEPREQLPAANEVESPPITVPGMNKLAGVATPGTKGKWKIGRPSRRDFLRITGAAFAGAIGNRAISWGSALLERKPYKLTPAEMVKKASEYRAMLIEEIVAAAEDPEHKWHRESLSILTRFFHDEPLDYDRSLNAHLATFFMNGFHRDFLKNPKHAEWSKIFSDDSAEMESFVFGKMLDFGFGNKRPEGNRFSSFHRSLRANPSLLYRLLRLNYSRPIAQKIYLDLLSQLQDEENAVHENLEVLSFLAKDTRFSYDPAIQKEIELKLPDWVRRQFTASRYYRETAFRSLIQLAQRTLKVEGKPVTSEAAALWLHERLGRNDQIEDLVLERAGGNVSITLGEIDTLSFYVAYLSLLLAADVPDPNVRSNLINMLRMIPDRLEFFDFLKDNSAILSLVHDDTLGRYLYSVFDTLQSGWRKSDKKKDKEAAQAWQRAVTTFQSILYLTNTFASQFVAPVEVLTVGEAAQKKEWVDDLKDIFRHLAETADAFSEDPVALIQHLAPVIAEDLAGLLRKELKLWDGPEKGNGLVLASLYTLEEWMSLAGIKNQPEIDAIKTRFALFAERSPEEIPDELALMWHMVYGDDETMIRDRWNREWDWPRSRELWDKAPWQALLMRSVIGITAEDSVYPASLEEMKKIRRIFDSQQEGINASDPAQFTLYLALAANLRFFGEEYLFEDAGHEGRGVLRRDFFARHQNYEPTWVNAHYRPAVVGKSSSEDNASPSEHLHEGTNRIGGSIAALPSETAHLYSDLVALKHQAKGKRIPEYEDRVGRMASTLRIPYLLFNDAQDYVAATYELGRSYLEANISRPELRKDLLAVLGEDFYFDRYSDALKTKNPEQLIGSLSPSIVYFIGKFVRDRKKGAPSPHSAAAFRRIDEIEQRVRATDERLEDFKTEIDQIAGIAPISMIGADQLQEVSLGSYARYYDFRSTHQIGERLSADLAIQLAVAMKEAGVPAKNKPWLILPALESQLIELRRDKELAKLREPRKQKPTDEDLKTYERLSMKIIELVRKITPENVKSWVDQNSLLKRGRPATPRKAKIRDIFEGRMIDRLAQARPVPPAIASSLGAGALVVLRNEDRQKPPAELEPDQRLRVTPAPPPAPAPLDDVSVSAPLLTTSQRIDYQTALGRVFLENQDAESLEKQVLDALLEDALGTGDIDTVLDQLELSVLEKLDQMENAAKEKLAALAEKIALRLDDEDALRKIFSDAGVTLPATFSYAGLVERMKPILERFDTLLRDRERALEKTEEALDAYGRELTAEDRETSQRIYRQNEKFPGARFDVGPIESAGGRRVNIGLVSFLPSLPRDPEVLASIVDSLGPRGELVVYYQSREDRSFLTRLMMRDSAYRDRLQGKIRFKMYVEEEIPASAVRGDFDRFARNGLRSGLTVGYTQFQNQKRAYLDLLTVVGSENALAFEGEKAGRVPFVSRSAFGLLVKKVADELDQEDLRAMAETGFVSREGGVMVFELGAVIEDLVNEVKEQRQVAVAA